MCPDWGKSNITPNQGLYPSLFLISSFFRAHTVCRHTSSCAHISCLQLPPGAPHFSQFIVFSEIPQRQMWATPETCVMNMCWSEKTSPAKGIESHKWCQLTALTCKAVLLRCTTSDNVSSGFPVTFINGKETKATGCKRKRAEGETPCPRECTELPCKQRWHICELLIACKY